MRVTIIVAMTPSGLIGKQGGLPWRLPEDLRHFKETTTGHTVVMGRKTVDEIKKALPRRRNLAVTRSVTPPPVTGIEWFSSLENAFAAARATHETECFIIGGGEIYRLALQAQLVDRMIVTYVHLKPEPDGDTWFPQWDAAQWREVERRQGASDPVEFVTYERLRAGV